MLVRGALRLAADVPSKTHPHDLPQLACFLHRTLLARNAFSTPAVRALSRAYRTALSDYRRSYATTTRATKPTATVKKAVKAKAASKTTTKKPATKKTAAASKAKRKITAKKPAPKKKVAKKPAPKKRVKKEVTPEAKLKAQIRELRKIALVAPCTQRRLAAHTVFIGERVSGPRKDGEGNAPATTRMVQANAEWRNLPASEREHYNHLANEQTEARRAEYAAWIKSHTPEQIKAANNARSQLRRKLAAGAPGTGTIYTAKLVDDRQIKRPVSAYALFNGERQRSGDLKGIKMAEQAKLVSEEWKALSEGEKKKYLDAAAADRARYEREVSAST